ncbi:hypothetical protein DMH04_24115 [Kibdelosporangium aridum]|uniref:Uncharacterized protein n=1 Tax=Kibdelosporangium aridum TaxID=2030 RepID=A0A428Z717_KIBAR|nr:hypothetical protein [Kibdelosporangium aridum]RSM83217.1 hypothetical protein DMH04_24115 [Kibdelosporangium aridum]
MTEQSTIDSASKGETEPQTSDTETEFTAMVNEMVADQAPQVFAVVLERDDQSDATVAAWGMSFDDQAYMVKANGNSKYFLADAENALAYIHRTDNATPQLVWVNPTADASED